jgi:hypothetical protein
MYINIYYYYVKTPKAIIISLVGTTTFVLILQFLILQYTKRIFDFTQLCYYYFNMQ